MGVLQAVWLFVRGFFAGRAALLAENLALRHQLAVLRRSVKRPKLRTRDRVFWIWPSRLWSGWRPDRGRRLLHGTDGDIPRAVGLRGPAA